MLDKGHVPLDVDLDVAPLDGLPAMVRARPRRGEAHPLAPRDRRGLREAHRRDDGRGGGGRPRKGHARRRVGPAADRHSRGRRALRRRRLAEPRRRPGDGRDVAPHRPPSGPPRAARSGAREPARRPRPLPPLAPALARRPRLVARRQRGAREEALLVRRQRRGAGDARAGPHVPVRDRDPGLPRPPAPPLRPPRLARAHGRRAAALPRRRRTRSAPWTAARREAPVGLLARSRMVVPRLGPARGRPRRRRLRLPQRLPGPRRPRRSRRSSRRAPGRRRGAGIPTVSPRRRSSCSALRRDGRDQMSGEHHFTASVTWDANERSGALASGTGHLSTTFGGAPSLGGRVDRTNPEELLLGALLACFVQTWAIFLTKLRAADREPARRRDPRARRRPGRRLPRHAGRPLRPRPGGAPGGAGGRRGEDAGARREVLHRLEGGEGRGARGARHAGRASEPRRARGPPGGSAERRGKTKGRPERPERRRDRYQSTSSCRTSRGREGCPTAAPPRARPASAPLRGPPGRARTRFARKHARSPDPAACSRSRAGPRACSDAARGTPLPPAQTPGAGRSAPRDGTGPPEAASRQ